MVSGIEKIGWFCCVGLIAACLTGCGRTPDVTLHPASAFHRLSGPTGVEMPPASDRYQVSAASGESESFQILVKRIVSPGGTPPMAVTVRLEPVGEIPDGTAPETDVRLYQVLDVHYTGPVKNPTFQVPPGNEGWVPDICMPLSDGPAVAQPHDPDRVTILVDVTPDTPAAEYRLVVSTPDSDAPPAMLEFSVKRFPVRIPDRFEFMTGVTWNWGIDKYLGRELTDAERMAFIDFFLDFRFTPAWFFSRGPKFSGDEIRRILERGGNMFQLFHIGGGGKRLLSDKDKKNVEPKLKEWRQQMIDLGAIDFCYALIGDEPSAEAIPVIRRNAEWLKSVFPELNIWVASRPRKELLDVVDAWDTVTAHSTDYYADHSFTEDSLELVRASDHPAQYWWFFSVEPYRPEPNCRIDNPLVDSRAIGWLSFSHGLDGFEYFWATDWANNAELKELPVPEMAAKWNLGLSGAGQLCYPMQVDGAVVPIPSLRLVALRDAMEDWALFRLIGDPLKKEYTKDVRDADTLAAIRARALEMLSVVR